MAAANKNIELYISDSAKARISDFRLNLMKEELKAINEKYPIEKNTVDIHISYALNTDEGIEVEFYIRNSCDRVINFDQVALMLVKECLVIATIDADLREVGNIPPFSAVPALVVFKDVRVETEDLANVEIQFSNEVEFAAIKTVEVDIDNIPENLQSKYRRTIEKYAANLPRLKKDSVDLNAYDVFYDEEGNINVVLFIRNGYDRNLRVKRFPLGIYNADDVLIYHGEFNARELAIKANSSILTIVKIPKELQPITDTDLSKFRVVFN
ncbi:SLAP domain-containing protein [Clostridium thermarum]|uniref:SLAP domain-containing protein n=1 Tax=Clostridium thermarum TaxID=1716543 RepID=UPI0011220886|nr:SLAP domain-containing protein [Clostridium thermarum]